MTSAVNGALIGGSAVLLLGLLITAIVTVTQRQRYRPGDRVHATLTTGEVIEAEVVRWRSNDIEVRRLTDGTCFVTKRIRRTEPEQPGQSKPN
jgi:hypothetical protein